MAYLLPSDVTKLALGGGHTPELETLAMLRSGLSNDFSVFHGVHWTREYRHWTHYGEIDFVVLNRSGDVLLIEQKNGPLHETGEGLVKRYADGETNVVSQVHRSLDKVREKFAAVHGRHRKLEVDYLVYCPEHQVRNVNAAGLNAERVVDASGREGLAARIEDLLGRGVEGDPAWFRTVHAFFCQTFQVIPDIHAHVSAYERTYIREAGGPLSVLCGLEMEPFRLRYRAVAGSGKSLLASRFCARQADRGARGLLVCFNRPLAEQLSQRVDESVTVRTFYGFCHAFLEACGRNPDFSNRGSDPDFWRSVQEQVMEEEIGPEWVFDYLVVDEGQDFDQEWVEILKLFLREDADMLWLGDPNQNLMGKPEVELEDFVGYRSNVNYRTPYSIAEFIRRSVGYDHETANDLPGLGAEVHGYDDPAEQVSLAARVIQERVRQGFSYEDIVIVSCGGLEQSIFSRQEKVGAVDLRRFTGEYDSNGHQVMTKGQLLFDSIRRFKGKEAPAVILVDVDPSEPLSDRDRQLLLCGMTRPTVRLDILARRENPANRLLFDA